MWSFKRVHIDLHLTLFLLISSLLEVHGQMVWCCDCVHVPVDEASQDRRSHRLYGAAVQRLDPDHQHDPDQPQVQHLQSTHYCSLTPSYPPNRPRMTGIVCLLCRHDTCKSISGEYQLTKTPGRFHYHSASEFSSSAVNPSASASACRVTAVYVSLCVFALVEWNADMDAYVVHTNYNEYALVVMYKQKPGGEKTTSVKLYGKTWGFFSFMISNQTSTAYYL